MYRHPELCDPSNELQGRPGSERKHDIYSLGLILLEIGIWKRIDTLQREGASPAENAKRFLKFAQRYLPHQMGIEYCEAVVECLDTERQGLSKMQGNPSREDVKRDEMDDDERGGVSLELFIEKVIYRLETCHCRG